MSIARRQALFALGWLFAGAGLSHAETLLDRFDVNQYRGKVVYLDFWASWCAPCQLSFPYMARLLTFYSAGDFALVAVNVDHDHAQAEAFLQRFGGSIPVVFDPRGAIASAYRVQAMPTSLLIGRDGRTRYVHSGFFPEQVALYDSQITELIHER